MAQVDDTRLSEVGERIADARRSAGLTQGALAEHLGIPLGVVDSFELGRADPSKHIKKVADATGRSSHWLLTGSEALKTADSMLVLLGERIREARQAAGLTESELADRLGLVEEDVAEYESGARDASAQVERIAEATGRPSSWFRGEAEAPGVEGAVEEALDNATEAAARSEPEDELDRLFASLARQRDELRRRQVESDRRAEELESRTADLDARDRELRQSQEEFEQEWIERLGEFEELQRQVIEVATTLADRASALRRALVPGVDAPEPARGEEQPV